MSRRIEKTIGSYTHPPVVADEQQPDTAPGNYYVSARDGDKYWLLSGPYVNDHAGALAMVAKVRAISHREHARSHFYAFGTCRRDEDAPLGSFQKAGYDLQLNRAGGE